MTLSMERVVKRLRARPAIDEWLVREQVIATTVRELGKSDLISSKTVHRFEITVLSDRRAIRGEATFVLSRQDDDLLERRIDAAIKRARRNTGPQWRLPRPAAPARVRVADQRLIADPGGALDDLAGALASNEGARVTTATLSIVAARERVSLSTGFDHSYDSTAVTASGTIALGDRGLRASARFSRAHRRGDKLGLEAALARESAMLRASAGASAQKGDTYDLVIASSALERGHAVDEWLSPIAGQASGQLARRGLSRYQPGQSALTGAGGDAITITSDGTIDYLAESAPVDEWGGPVRRFSLIEDGRAMALALTSREAALRGEDGNGGARNLALAAGTRSLSEMSDGTRPRLTIESLDTLRANEASGELAAQIGLARIDDGPEVFTGGHFTLNLFDALSRLRVSRASPERTKRGPAWIAIPNVRVV